MLDRGLRRRFDPLVEREARAAAEQPPHGRGRRGATCAHLPTFTIDPPTARDFDDAISAERLDDGAIRVWVHIADVSAHVHAGLARRPRGAPPRAPASTSPARSSRCCPRRSPTGACSLVPGQDRLAVTVELEFEGAKVRAHAPSTAR